MEEAGTSQGGRDSKGKSNNKSEVCILNLKCYMGSKISLGRAGHAVMCGREYLFQVLD
jgi:hypothetical protein